MSVKSLVLWILIFTVSISTRLAAQPAEETLAAAPDGCQLIPGRLIVNFQPAIFSEIDPTNIRVEQGILTTGLPSLDAIHRELQVYAGYRLFPEAPAIRTRGKAALRTYYIIQFPETVDLDRAKTLYAAHPLVEHVEFDLACPVYEEPNDPHFGQQWAMPRIQAPLAWDLTHGSEAVSLASCDTGVDWNHPDLAENIWQNLGEDADGDGTVLEWTGSTWVYDPDDENGVDDDGNGFVDDFIGWDFLVSSTFPAPGEDGDTPDNDPMDFNGHGTHVAGIISATTDNEEGVAGTGYNCKIMCLRNGYQNIIGLGLVDMSASANAFYYGTNMGVTAINCSWGSSNGGGLAAATDYAIENGVLIVTAAGNANNQEASYLASRDDVMSVAATDQNDIKASFSSYGTWVDISAPGVNIHNTMFDDTYADLDGTSMASPHVVGLAGLIKSVAPDWQWEEIYNRIQDTADNIDDVNPDYAGLLGAGRINAFQAVQGVGDPDIEVSVSEFHVTQDEGDPAQLTTMTIFNYGSETLSFSITDDQEWIETDPSTGELAPRHQAEIAVTIGGENVPAGEHTGEISITSNDPDESPFTIPVFLTVQESGPTYTITGQVTYSLGSQRGIPNATLYLGDNYQQRSSTSGDFSFEQIPPGNYALWCENSEDNTGISTFDAAQIARFVTGNLDFNEYQQMAADVTGDGNVSMFDAARVAQYAAELNPPNTRAGQWQFLPERYSYIPLDSDQTQQNFVGILYGEVSGNWSPPGR